MRRLGGSTKCVRAENTRERSRRKKVLTRPPSPDPSPALAPSQPSRYGSLTIQIP